MWTSRRCLILTLSVVTVALSLGAARTAPAKTLPVACDAEALVAAISRANANGKVNNITLAPDCVYTLRSVQSNAKGPSGLPAITGKMTISGNGAVIERSSDPATPPFRILFVDTTGELTLQDLTVRNGRLPAAASGQPGPDWTLCRGSAGGQRR